MRKMEGDKINNLLKDLGYQIMITDKPLFNWNGNTITSDNTAPVKMVSTFNLNEKFGFLDFLSKYSDKKIVLFDYSEDEVRAFIG